MLKDGLHGFLMALADSVPGVSGGTIAFIMGFYERLLAALSTLSGRDNARRRAAIVYLAKLILGWAVGMGASVLVLAQVFERHIYFMSSLFLGLTVGAIPFVLREERNTLKDGGKYAGFAVLGAALVVLLTALRASSAGVGAVDFRSLSLWQYGYLAVSGALAISAMLLPGISGSTLLLILGVYVPLIGAAREVLHLHLQFLPGVCAVAVGIVLGIVLAARLIRRALVRFRCQTVWLILGLMVGSLYAIVMGATTLTVPTPPLSLASFRVVAFLLGMALLGGLEWMKHVVESKTPEGASGGLSRHRRRIL